MNRPKLHNQADRIEWVLQQHHAPARVTGGRVTPRTIQFHVQPAAATKVARVEALSEEIALALGASQARITRDRNHINIEVPRHDGRTVRFMSLAHQLEHDEQIKRALHIPGTALLGLDADGIPLLVRLASPDVTHILVSGTTGSGKSELVRTIVASLAYFQKPREIQIVILDPKGTTFRFMEQAPHLLFDIAVSLEECLVQLRWLEHEMENRQRQGVSRPRLVVAVDELSDLMMQGGREVQVHLTRLAQRGRSAGISLLACTQKPTAAVLGAMFKSNFPVRLVGRVTCAEDARAAAGIPGTGAEKLAGRGDFVLVAGGERVRFQAAYLSNGEATELFRHSSTSGTAHIGGGIKNLIGRLVRPH